MSGSGSSTAAHGGRLLERDEALGVLHAALEAAVEGDGRVALVAGEAGIGKTSVVGRFAAELPADTRLLRGACDALFTPRPLGPFYDMARDLDEPLARRLDDGADRVALFSSLLESLAAEPTVAVFEDVHWADEATLDVLKYLGRRIDRSPCLLVLTYRDDELGAEHPLRRVLGELPPGRTSRVELRPLSEGAVAELAAETAQDASALHALTGGNPFFLTEVLAAGAGGVPATVRDAVLARALGLPGEARAVLDLASVVPGAIERWLLHDILRPEPGSIAACVERGMLVPRQLTLAFRHELARQAILEALDPLRRAEYDRDVLAALESRPDRDALLPRLAHHADAAGDSDAVLRYAPAAAARASAVGSNREAAAQYERALRHAAGVETTERLALLEKHAHSSQAIGDHPKSIAARREAIELCSELGDVLRQGTNLSLLALPYIASGLNVEAEEASRLAIELLEELPPSPELGMAYGYRSYLRMLSRDNAEGVAWGEKALDLAERFGDEELRAHAFNLIGTSHLMAGGIEKGTLFLQRSLELSLELDIPYRVVSAYSMLGSGLGEMYELEEAERWQREYLSFTRRYEFNDSYIRSWLAATLAYRGRWDEGAELASELLHENVALISRVTALIVLGRIRARRGDPGAADVLDEALELALPGGHLQRLGHVHAARAEAAWLEGDATRTLEEARAVYGLALGKRHLWFAGELAYWQWKCGEDAQAPDWVAEPYRRQLDGDVRGGADAWRARGCPYEAARALADAGEEELLRDALDEFERLGARPGAEHVRRVLRERGVRGIPRRPRAGTRENPAQLTPRELEVLQLLAEGLRNAVIAERLVLSTRTVDHHVAAIRRKLGVRTRGEAVAEASALGLLEDRQQTAAS